MCAEQQSKAARSGALADLLMSLILSMMHPHGQCGRETQNALRCYPNLVWQMLTRRCMTDDSSGGASVELSDASMQLSASAPKDCTLLLSSDRVANAAGLDLLMCRKAHQRFS